MKKRLVSALLALSMLCSAVPAPAFAQGADSTGLEQEHCSCSIRCTADGMNPDCPVCAADAAACGAGLDPATVETADPEPTPEPTVTPVPTETPAPAGEPAPQTLGLAPNLLAANDGASTLAREGTKPVGEGTQEAPYQISTADDLFWFAALVNGTLEGVEQNAAACAVLTTNITISEGRAWTPIGNSIDNQYTGTFDGAGFTIDNLKIDNGSAQFQGFVGCLGAGGKLQNLTMGASCSVTGYSPVGGLCSRNQGTIENCTNRGTVSGLGTVGGVCGSNVGTITGCTNSGEVTGNVAVGGVCGINQSTITGCTNSGEVTGSDQYVGGVCGENVGGGTIQNCTNKAEVTGSSKVGGVCGGNYDPITGCTNSGAVSGGETVGGLCGYNSSNITYCYSTGTVTSNGNNVGGVCGFNGNAGALTNCYWLDTAYSDNGVGTNNGTVNNVYSKTDTAFSSGAVCWLLNGESADSPVWYQNLGTDTYPVLDSSHGTVYCIDKGLSFYSNDSNAKLDISDATVALSQERFTYNGTVQKPTVTVTLGGKTLTENTHYTVAYSGNCIDAGDYAVTVTGTGVCSGTVSEKHTIYPAEISIASATVQDKTYDGGTTATVESVEFTGLVNGESLTSGTDYTVTATFADKNVGDSKQATVTVTLTNGNYTFVQGGNTTTATAKIAPLAVALTWSTPISFTYDGSEHSVTAEVANKVDGDTLNLTYAGNTEKNVGNYTATVTALDSADAANYTLDGVENLTQAWSIASASLAGAEVTLDESTFTYTGSEQKPTVTVKLGGKTLDAGTDYDVDFGGDSINADTYTVTVTGKGNYSGTATEKPTYTINPAALTISDATLAAKTYDGTTAATVIDVTFTGLQNGETLTLGSGYTATAVFDDANAGTDKTATVTVTLKNGNYTFADGSETTYTLTGQTIAKAAAAVAKAPAAVAELTYNGQDQALVTAGTATGGTMMYRLGENGDYTDAVPTGTNAGDYTVYYYVQGDTNHNDTQPVKVDVTIAKATPTVTKDPEAVTGLTYTGQPQTLVTAGTATGGTLLYSLEKDGSYDAAIPTGTNAGDYTVFYYVQGDANHNDTAKAQVEVTITKADAAVNTAPAANTLTYTGQPQALVTAGTATGGTLVYSLEKDGSYDAAIPTGTNAGDYTVFYYVQGDANHSDTAKAQVKVTIAKADPALAWTDQTVTYTGEQAVITAPTVTLVNGETYDSTFTYQYKAEGAEDFTDGLPTEAGSYTVRASMDAQPNYNAASVTMTLTIEKAAATAARTNATGSVMVGASGSTQLPTLPEGAGYGTPQAEETYLTGLDIKDGHLYYTGTDAVVAGSTYTATVPVTGAKNYKDYQITVTLTGTNKLVPTLTVEDFARDYTGKALTLEELTKSAVYDGTPLAGSWAFAAEAPKNAGEYSVELVFTPDDAHYAQTSVTCGVTINKLDATVAVELSTNRVEYGQGLPGVNLVYTGVLKGESLAPDSFTVDGMPGDSTTAGTYAVALSQESRDAIRALADANNYNITFTGATLTVLPQSTQILPAPEVPDAEPDTDYRLEQSELTVVPEELKEAGFNSVDEIQDTMYEVAVKALPGITDENTEFHDVTLLFSEDGGQTWVKATEENFPKDGITVTLPYPDGTNAADYDFVVTHMVTVAKNDLNVGDVETPAVTKTADGLRFTVKSLSPVAVSWKLAPKTESSTGSSESTSPAATPAPTAAPDGTVYYTCPACGHHDWTATDTGYRCDTCGYVESLKQLAGYGNVKGVYEPKTGSNTAGGHAVTVPQTGDTSNPALWLGLLLLSGLALGGITLYRRKKTQ